MSFPQIPNAKTTINYGAIQVASGLRAAFDAGPVIAFEEANQTVIIDAFEYSCNNSSIYPVLQINSAAITSDFDNQLFYTVNPGGTRWHATATRLANDDSPYFDVIENDDANLQYKFILKAPIAVPPGSRLAFKFDGTATTSDNVTYKAVYRKV